MLCWLCSLCPVTVPACGSCRLTPAGDLPSAQSAATASPAAAGNDSKKPRIGSQLLEIFFFMLKVHISKQYGMLSTLGTLSNGGFCRVF